MASKRKPITTAAQLKALAPEDRAFVVSVATDKGLYLKVQTSGRKTWFYRYRVGERFEWLKLGDFKSGADGMSLAAARVELGVQRKIKQEHGSAKKFREVQQAERAAALEASHAQTVADDYTVEAMCREYIDVASRDLKTWVEVDRALKANVTKVIGNRPARDVRRAEIIAEVLEPLNKRGKFIAANRTLANLRRTFNWAINSGKFDDGGPDIANPCARIEMNKERPKERTLSDSEIRRLLAALPDSGMTETEQDLIVFLLLTGLRVSEAAGASIDHIDEDERTLTIPETKNGRAHRVPLRGLAYEIATRREAESKWLFPLKTNVKKHIQGRRVSNSIRDALPKLKTMKFTAHDLRRSFATGLAQLKTPRLIISLALNHTIPGVTSRYDKYEYTDELCEAFEKWSDHVEGLTGESPVTSIHKGKASSR